MADKFETSKSSGVHAQLARLEGSWEGMTRVWFEPDKVEDESPMKGTMRLVLGGRFILHEYQGSFGGKPLEGIAIYGYHLALGKYQCAWVDSYHNGTAIMLSESKREADVFSMLGSYTYVSPEMEQEWGWRTEIDFVNDDEVRITAYNVFPDGHEEKATEVLYKRVK